MEKDIGIGTIIIYFLLVLEIWRKLFQLECPSCILDPAEIPGNGYLEMSRHLSTSRPGPHSLGQEPGSEAAIQSKDVSSWPALILYLQFPHV